MSGNIIAVSPHATFEQKISNFPDSIYNFDADDNLTTLMQILLGNSGTGQLRNLQTIARLSQQNIEFSNLDNILGLILGIQRTSSEIYSFSTNPFIDQLTDSQWQEVVKKDSSYRERLLGAAEAFQTGATIWGILTLCEAMTQQKFYAVESWRTPGLGRTGIPKDREVVLIPLNSPDGFWKWDNSKARAILEAINMIFPAQFIVSFGAQRNTFTTVPLTASGSASSEYFFLQANVNASQLNTPGNIQPGASTRYWIQNNVTNTAPYFAHLQSQEIIIDMTGNISSVAGSDIGNPSNSVSIPSVQVTSTFYGGQ